MPDYTQIYDPDFVESLRKKVPVEGKTTGTEINLKQATGSEDLEVDAKARMYGEGMGLHPSKVKSVVPEIDRAVKHLSYEDRKRSIDSQFKVAQMQNDIAFLAYDLMEGNGNPQAALYQIRRLEKEIARESKWIVSDGIFQKAVNSAAQILPSMITTTAGGIKVGGYAALGAMGTAALLGQAGPQIAAPEEIVTVPVAGVTAFMAGTRIQASRLTAQMEAGMAYYELLNLEDEQGNRISPQLARAVAHSVGGINGLIEAFGLGIVMKNMPGTKQMYERVIKKTIFDAVTKGTFKNILLRAAKSYGKTIGGETLQEVSQEITQILGEEIAKKLENEMSKANFSETDIDAVKKRLWDTLESTALGMTVFSGFGAGGNVTLESVAEVRSRIAKKHPIAVDLLPEDTEYDPGDELYNAYKSYKNIFLGNRDVRMLRNRVAASHQKRMLKALAKETKTDERKLNAAIQLYIDAPPGSTNATRVEKLFGEKNEEGKVTPTGRLTQEHLDLWEMSRNLTDKQKVFAKKLQDIYAQIGEIGLEDGVLRNMLDNYAARQWNLGVPDARQIYSTFYKATKHARNRVVPTIMHGWHKGLELRINGATENMALYRDTMIKTLTQRKFFNAISKVKYKFKDPVTGKRRQSSLFITTKRKGYKKINIDGWKIYSPVTNNVPGLKILETEDGTRLYETSVYAPNKVASDMEALFGVSKLKTIPGKFGKFVDVVTKYNAIMKAITLSLSAFHAFAYMRSYYLGGPIRWSSPRTWSVFHAYRDGVNMMKNLDPIVDLAIRNGLTLALQQDWQKEYIKQGNIMSKTLDKWSISRKIKDHVVNLNDLWLGFLFSSFGTGLKIKTFSLEFQRYMKKHPMSNPNQVAQAVAELVNDDFGGLHLERMGRNPTLQHIFQLLALAPDWTESNLRTVVGMFKKHEGDAKMTRQLYRRFWARIVMKGLVATTLLNVALAIMSGDGEDKWDTVEAMFKDMTKAYHKALKKIGKGDIKRGWRELAYGSTTASELTKMAFSIDVTPMYEFFAGRTAKRKYVSLFGHFMDPVKFIRHPNKVLRHKQSIVAGMAWEFVNGEDWAGRRFTSLPELLQHEGLSTYKSAYNEGVPIVDSWYISFVLAQLIGHSPVGTQNLISSISGETDYFDSILGTLGLQVSTSKK